MDLKQAIYGRRAVRDYTTEPLDEETIRHLIEAAIQAPSAVNQQPWSFCVVRDKALLARISHEAKYAEEDASGIVVASFPRVAR